MLAPRIHATGDTREDHEHPVARGGSCMLKVTVLYGHPTSLDDFEKYYAETHLRSRRR